MVSQQPRCNVGMEQLAQSLVDELKPTTNCKVFFGLLSRNERLVHLGDTSGYFSKIMCTGLRGSHDDPI